MVDCYTDEDNQVLVDGYCSNSSMVDCYYIYGYVEPDSYDVQIPLWSIATDYQGLYCSFFPGSNSSMVDCYYVVYSLRG